MKLMIPVTVKRVEEPELMNKASQVEAYTNANFSASDGSYLESLAESIELAKKTIDSDTLIMDIGCGPGKLTELIAKTWPQAKTIGIEGSAEMIRMARLRKKQNNSNSDLSGLSYLFQNMHSISNGKSKIDPLADVLVSNSVLHHLHDVQVFWRTVKKLSREDSIQFHRDLRRPSSIEEATALQRKYLPSAPEVLRKDYLASLLAAFNVDEVKSQLSEAGLESLEVREVDDRYLEIVGTSSKSL